jgi:hypothetical protein
VFYSWYLPERPEWLWVCGALLLVFIPISIRHNRNWKRTLAQYAEIRREAGASDQPWPAPDLAFVMGLQLWLVVLVTTLLAGMTLFAAWAAWLWPFRPPGFDLPVNPFDLPYLWSFIVAGCAATVAGVTLAVAVARSPWWPVARRMRRAIYADPEARDRFFDEALQVDPELSRERGSGAPEDPAS